MKIIKKIIKNILINILRLRKLKNIIVFECTADMTGNSYEVYKYAKKQKLDREYKLLLVLNDFEKYKKFFNKSEIIKYPRNKFEYLLFFWKISQAKCLVYENKELKKFNNKQYAINLTHGTPIKNTRQYMWQQKNIDHVLFQSEFVKNNAKRLFNIYDENKLVCLGFPRNDLLFSNINLNTHFNFNYKKIVVWLPTFRQSIDNERVDSDYIHPYGIPIFEEMEQINKLNSLLNENNILLLIKPHPGQNIENLTNFNLTNIKIIYNDDIEKMNIQLYELLAGSDALITDYSSVYFDYLLTNKPIGITIDDIENYKRTLGFAFSNIEEILVGEKIRNYDNLVLFFDNLIKNIDSYYEERKLNSNLFNYYKDNNSTERVYNFILNNIKKKHDNN